MKIIDGKGAVMGRLASYAAKEAMKGEDIVIVNCDEIIITGNKKDIMGKFEHRKTLIGSGHQGPKHSRDSVKIVKRAIRGMLPTHRHQRGKIALKKIKCYKGIPKEFENEKKIVGGRERKIKFIKVGKLEK